MLRRATVLLGRPKGPPGLAPGKEHRLTVPYRSEVTMLRQCGFKRFNSNIRELFKKPLVQNNIKAIPRDLGELPRNYVLKQLFFDQPARLLDLWEVLKKRDDVPIDSAKHLRLVLKVAKMQKWVYAEKNQSNNLYYYHIHASRVHEVQDMVRQDEVERKNAAAREAAGAVTKQADAETQSRTVLDDSITALQSLLVSNLGLIQNFDSQYGKDKPYMQEDGAVNVAWHWIGAADAARFRQEADNREQERVEAEEDDSVDDDQSPPESGSARQRASEGGRGGSGPE